MTSQLSDYDAAYRKSTKSPDLFWGDLGRERLKWCREFDQVMDCDPEKGEFKWFIGGKINVSVNCIDRHLDKYPDKVALLWEKNKLGEHERITYRELYEMTCRVANVLRREEVKKGDRVAIYMPICPLQVAAMLACARIGAIHCVIFGGFSSEALRDRISDCSCKVVFTADQAPYKKDFIPLKQRVDDALSDDALRDTGCVEKVFVFKRTGAEVKMNEGRDVWLEEAMSEVDSDCPPEQLDSEDTLFILYTSGSTGNPKGIVHTQAGYLLYASLTQQYVFNYNPEKDIFACVADIGWITGHSYVVYGPLCNGGTTVLCEFHRTHPDAGRYWEMVDRLKVTHFYTVPTTIRVLLGCGDKWVNQYSRSSLRILGCVGEPLDKKAWRWYNDIVGRGTCKVVDTYWQTETGGVMIAPLPAPKDAPPPMPQFPTRPFWGIIPVLIDENGVQNSNGMSGDLYIEKPWPGQARTIWQDHARFVETYYKQRPGYYFTGDGALRDHEGKYRITGRVDDVITIDGHRIGTAEIESVMNREDRVSETAIIQYTDEFNRKDVLVFVTLEKGITVDDDVISKALQNIVDINIGKFVVPKFLVVRGLPKTRSEKIMRSVLRKIAEKKADQHELEKIYSLANPEVIQLIHSIIEKHNNQKPLSHK